MMNPSTMDRYAVQSVLYNIASSFLKNLAVEHDMDIKIMQFKRVMWQTYNQTCESHNYRPNLSKSETIAIKELRKRTDIIIKKANKGPQAIIWAKSDYEEEARRQLSNSAVYQQVIKDSINVASLLRDHLDSAVSQHMLSLPDTDKMKPLDNSPGKFYLLPKVHKAQRPFIGRSIVNCIGNDI
ncbi:hypothetical protein GJ496_006736 [Pomphorhynchus laevis]|nr:hypothetical protein GJ496_006736 [Pomphorhynchus laevis]